MAQYSPQRLSKVDYSDILDVRLLAAFIIDPLHFCRTNHISYARPSRFPFCFSIHRDPLGS